MTPAAQPSSVVTSTESVIDPIQARVAFAELGPAREKLAADRLLRVTVDTPRTCAKVLAASERLVPYHERLGRLPDYDLAAVKDLPRRARALLHAYNLFLTATGDVDRVKALLAEGLPLRELLLDTWAPPLVNWGVFTAAQLSAWKEGAGHADAAGDLVSLGEAYLSKWSLSEGKVNVSRARVERAAQVGSELLVALGQKGAGHEVKEAGDTLRRSFTLVVLSYDEARRGISFLRWKEEDADEILPSIYQRKGSGRPRKEEMPPDDLVPTPG